MRFVVEDDVFDKLENVCFGVVVARGIDNARAYPEVSRLLAASVEEAECRFDGKRARDAEEILPYREAFAKLGMNPNKFMSSIEALMTRIEKKKGLPSINPVVDMGNAVSLKYVLPIGAHDMDAAHGDIRVRFSRAGDVFVPFGGGEMEALDAGELIYAVGDKVKTRRWIWRQSENGKIATTTRNVFFPIDGFSGINDGVVLRARDELADRVARFFGCDVATAFVDSARRVLDL